MTDMSLETRVRRLEDIEAIRRLKSLYSHYANVGEGSGSPEKFAALFTEDGEFDLVGNPKKGRAAILAHMRHVESLGYHGLHFALNPRIDVDGDSATGEWDLCFPVVLPGERKPAVVVCGFYKDRLVRTTEGWRFTYVCYRVSPKFSLAG